jgi:hypothetical protein
MTQEQRKEIERTTREIERTGAPVSLVVAHYFTIGDRAAQTITAERIGKEYDKQKEEEHKAEARGMVCLMSAEFVGALLTGCQILASVDNYTRAQIVKKYL